MSGIQLKGDWRKLNHIAKRLGDCTDEFKNELITELAEDVRQSLHEVINSSPPPANAERTIQNKGFDTPMMETGHFMDDNSVVASPYIDGKKIGYIIQGNPEMNHERSEVSYDELVVINTEGGGNTPGRDLLDIAFDRKRSEIEHKCLTRIVELWR